MTPPAARGRCQGGSIACSDCGDHIYQCAKFGACFQKCTNIVLSHWTIRLTKFDIMCLCETFIDCNVADDEISIQDYSVVLRNRNRHGGGVLIYVKNGIKYTNITNLDTHVENVFINIEHNNDSLAVGVMYRPPSANIEYFTNMLDLLDQIYSNNNNVILLGDLNHDYDSSGHLVLNPLNQFETLYSMKQLVDVPTRVTLNTSSLLDVIFSTDHESHTVTGVYHTSLSDHYMIYTVYDRVRIIHDSNNKILKFRNYKKFSSERFIKDILACDCIYDTSWDSSLLEAKWDEFKNVFITVSDIHAPLHCRKLKNRCNPWFDNDILEMIYCRDYVKRKAISYNDAALWQTYRSLRNVVTSTIRRKKKLYYDSKITDCQSNPKQLWNVIGQLTGRKQFDNIPADLSANDFNEYFSSIGSETVAHLSSAENATASNDTLFWRGSNCISRFAFTDVSIESVSSQLRALGLSSKNDVLGFDCKLLSMCSDLIAPIITKFANASIHTKCFASDWKLSRVTPIYKGKGDSNDKGNYRPISVIGHIAKIIEHEITNQVVTYLESNKLLTNDQSAYRAQHSTQTALHKVVDDWLYNITDGLHTTVCSFDIRKCFDTINHSILCKKMDKYGFHDDDIDLFRSYLSNRKQIVKCHNEISQMCDIHIGVPQGSVLGPILFLLYVNDINQHVHIGAACNLYADDTLVYCSANNVDTLQECTNNSIACIKQWYDMNKLVINTAKSNVMVVSSKQRHALSGASNIDVHLGNENIKQIGCI